MNEFLSMDGYGGYVWSSFAITVVVMLANIIITRREDRAVRQRLQRRVQSQPRKDA